MDVLVADAIDSIKGQHDDGTDEGVLNIKALGANWVPVPIDIGQETQTTLGTSSITNSTSDASNSDGSGRVRSITVPALTSGQSQQGVWIERTIYGPGIGVRFRRNNSGSLPPFTLWVDGVPYGLRNVNNRRHAATILSTADYEAYFRVAEDLGPGPHTCRLSVSADEVGGSSRSLVFLGWLADRLGGYRDPTPFSLYPVTAMAAMPTTLTAVTPSGRGGIRKLHYHNTDTNAHTVTLAISSDTATWKLLDVPAGKSVEYDFGAPVQVTFKHKADSTTVNWLPQESL